jgi:integrase/recombinase XerC
MTTVQPHVTTTSNGRQAELDAARLLLDRMGISPADLLATSRPRAAVPTFAQYVPRVREAVGEGTRRVYGSYSTSVVARPRSDPGS